MLWVPQVALGSSLALSVMEPRTSCGPAMEQWLGQWCVVCAGGGGEDGRCVPAVLGDPTADATAGTSLYPVPVDHGFWARSL